MTTRSERIALAIRHCGKQKGVVARESGITPGALSQWLSNDTQSQKPENLAAFAKSTGVRLEWLATGDGAMLAPVQDFSAATSLESNETKNLFPIYKEVILNSGERSIVDSGEFASIPSSTLERVGVMPQNVRMTHLQSDSMSPMIQMGALTAYDTSKTEVQGGKVYALNHGGVYRVRKIEAAPGGYRLIAENKNHPDEYLTVQEFSEQVQVMGWVFWWESFSHW